MNNPVLAEVTRGDVVESLHHGAVAVVDGAGRLVFSMGDVDHPVFPRSAVKGLQALPLIESGAADRFGLEDAELALACASHAGEEAHVTTAASMLAKAGISPACLECGAHWPTRSAATRALAAKGEKPSALHNNCSGKHAGFLCVAVAEGHDPKGYIAPDHPTMRGITAVLASMTGCDLAKAPRGTDGCSIPTYGIPLSKAALGFARFGTGEGLMPQRAEAAKRLRKAVAAAPFMVAGTGRFDTVIMQALGARAFVKTGAEGVYCAALPELGYGIALKVEDGASRAAEAAMAALLARFLPLNDGEAGAVSPYLDLPMTNWNGIEIGRTRAVAGLRG